MEKTVACLAPAKNAAGGRNKAKHGLNAAPAKNALSAPHCKKAQASLEALVLAAGMLAVLAVAAASAAAIQQLLVEAAIATKQAAALHEISAAANEVGAFSPGSSARVQVQLLAENTSLSQEGSELAMRYWSKGRHKKIAREASAEMLVENKNFSTGTHLLELVNENGRVALRRSQ